MTVSEWVDRTLQKAASDTLRGGTLGLALPPDLLATIDDISRKLDQIVAENRKDPDRLKALSAEVGNRLDEMRAGMNKSFERQQSSANSMLGSAVERTDTAITRSRRLADQALGRIIETGGAAVDSMRQIRQSDTKDPAKGSPTGKEN